MMVKKTFRRYEADRFLQKVKNILKMLNKSEGSWDFWGVSQGKQSTCWVQSK